MVCSGDASSGITFESIHGSDGVNIKAADLKLERFLSDADLAAAAAAAPASELPAQPARVLLTGANGFLGRFLLLDLLQRVSDKCVRAPFELMSVLMSLSVTHRCIEISVRLCPRSFRTHECTREVLMTDRCIG